MKIKGQTTIEVLVILAASLVALSIIYSLYAEQVNIGNFQREEFSARSSIQRIINASNSLVISGAGSQTTVEVDFSNQILLDETIIDGSTILIKLSNGTEIFGTADVDFVGNLRKTPGKQLINLYYDGSKVFIYYDDFELNQGSIVFSTIAGSKNFQNIILRNLSSEDLNFKILNNFSHLGINFSSNPVFDSNFLVDDGELKQIDLNFEISENISGNYSGNIVIVTNIEGQEIQRLVNISIEVLQEFKPILLTPTTSSFTTYSDNNITKYISLCNRTPYDLSGIVWEVQGSSDANLANWFNLPETNSVLKNSCEVIDINFNIPASVEFKVYDANLIANISNTSVVTSFFAEVVPDIFYSFLSSIDNNLVPNYNYSKFIKQNDNGYWVPTGELDWNRHTSNDWSINGSSWDKNLIAYYKFNDSDQVNIFDSARENNGLIINEANVIDQGMWGSNALSLDGFDQYVEIGTLSNMGDEFTFSSWIKTPESRDLRKVISVGEGLVGAPQLGISNGKIKISLFGSNALYSLEDYNNNLWHHVAGGINYDGNYFLYVNGQSQGSLKSNQDINWLGNLRFGAYFSEEDEFFYDGLIDEVKIYNGALTEEEILADYNSFLNARFVSDVVVDPEKVFDWNGVLLNSNSVSFENEKSRMQIDLNVFACDDIYCIAKTDFEYIPKIDNNNFVNLNSLENSRFLSFEVFFKPSTLNDGNLAGHFFNVPFFKDINFLGIN